MSNVIFPEIATSADVQISFAQVVDLIRRENLTFRVERAGDRERLFCAPPPSGRLRALLARFRDQVVAYAKAQEVEI